MSKQAAPLMRLPPELHLEIISHLKEEEHMDVYKLRLVNRHFYNTIDPPCHTALFALDYLNYARERSLYACTYCLRLRHASKFADRMLKGKTGREGDQTEKRFCADCGFDKSKPQRYMRGTQVRVNGELWVRCVHCDEVKRGIEVGETACQEACKSCHARYGCRWVKSSKRCETKKLHPLEVYGPGEIGVDCMDWRDLFL